jgi:hypothetical protein
VESLKARGFSVSICHSEPDYVRLSMLEAARITLSVQKTDSHHIFSPGRVPHAIMNRIPIIVEYDGPPCYLAEYCVVAKPQNFFDTCVAMVAQPDLGRLAQEFYDRFAAEFPMQPIMQRVVDETFGSRP